MKKCRLRKKRLTEDRRIGGLSVRWLWIIDFFKRKVFFVWKVKRLKVVGEDNVIEHVQGDVKEVEFKPKNQTGAGVREDKGINLSQR